MKKEGKVDSVVWLLFFALLLFSVYLFCFVETKSNKFELLKCVNENEDVNECVLKSLNEEKLWDECVYERNRLSGTQRAVDKNSHYTSMLVTHVNAFYYCFASISPLSVEWDSAFIIFFALTWIPATHNYVFMLKELLADPNCNIKANSVSGHFSFYIFHFLLWRYMNAANKKNRSIWMKITNMLIVPLVTFTLYRTYFGGYHTLRQIIYGATIGIFSFISFSFFCRRQSIGLVSLYSALIAFTFLGYSSFGRMESCLFLFFGCCMLVSYYFLPIHVGSNAANQHANQTKVNDG